MQFHQYAIAAALLALGLNAQGDDHDAESRERTDAMPEIVVIAEKVDDQSQPLIASHDTARSVHGAVLADLSERLLPERESIE